MAPALPHCRRKDSRRPPARHPRRSAHLRVCPDRRRAHHRVPRLFTTIIRRQTACRARARVSLRARAASNQFQKRRCCPPQRVAHGRGGDPAIASRLAHLESLLRRLLGSQLHSLDESDEAPAGPGVFLIADSDLVTSYYVESCKTLRIASGQLVRGGRGRREGAGASFKSRLAEHLEITESQSRRLPEEALRGPLDPTRR